MTTSYKLRNSSVSSAAPLYSTYASGRVVGDDNPATTDSASTTYTRVPYSTTSGTTYGDGIAVDSSNKVIAVPNGGFAQDYTYSSGSGILDQYQGRFTVTPDYPTGTYAYFITYSYPYIWGKRMRNTAYNASVPLTAKTTYT